jgi:sugar lactone lactonase YvrE
MDFNPRLRGFAGGKRVSFGPLGVALIIAAALSLVGVAIAGTPGTAGDTTADRELGQIDFNHTMFNFGGAGALAGLAGAAVDSAGHLYIGDSINNRVLGWVSASAFNNGDPADLVIGQPDVYSYQCDDGATGADVDGMGADSLCGPEGMAVDSAGNLYVADTIDNRVLEFSSPYTSGVTHGQAATMVFGQDGSLVTSGCNDGIGGGDIAGVGPDSLCDPRAVAVDTAGNLYVADSGASRVLEYNTPLDPGSGESGAGDALADAVFGQSNSFTTKLCVDGTAVGDVGGIGPDSLCGPNGVTADASGNVYVSDTIDNRILEYNTPLNAASGEAGAGDTVADLVFG